MAAMALGRKLQDFGERFCRSPLITYDLTPHRYNGRMTDTPADFPAPMEEACEIIERVVNEEMRKRKRFPLEWTGNGIEPNWRANVAASNCYEGSKESVGFHSDQMTYLGPYCTIGECVSRVHYSCLTTQR